MADVWWSTVLFCMKSGQQELNTSITRNERGQGRVGGPGRCLAKSAHAACQAGRVDRYRSLVAKLGHIAVGALLMVDGLRISTGQWSHYVVPTPSNHEFSYCGIDFGLGDLTSDKPQRVAAARLLVACLMECSIGVTHLNTIALSTVM